MQASSNQLLACPPARLPASPPAPQSTQGDSRTSRGAGVHAASPSLGSPLFANMNYTRPRRTTVTAAHGFARAGQISRYIPARYQLPAPLPYQQPAGRRSGWGTISGRQAWPGACLSGLYGLHGLGWNGLFRFTNYLPNVHPRFTTHAHSGRDALPRCGEGALCMGALGERGMVRGKVGYSSSTWILEQDGGGT